MGRSLNAPLSTPEEVTLRRIALGLTPTKTLSARAVARLRNLALPGARLGGFPVAHEQLSQVLATYIKEAKH